MFGYIYKTTNLINGKIYIGKREKPYFDKKYYGSGKYLKHAIDFYGIENFSCEVIEWCKTKKKLHKREVFWIAYYNSLDKNIGYNLAKGGPGGSTLGLIWINNGLEQKYTKIEDLEYYMSLGWKRGALPHSDVVCKKVSNSLLGHKVSKTTRQKISAACKGYKLTDEQKAKLRASQRGKAYVTNGFEIHQIKLVDLDLWLSKGYVRGRKLKKL